MYQVSSLYGSSKLPHLSLVFPIGLFILFQFVVYRIIGLQFLYR